MRDYEVGDTVYVTVIAKVTDVAASSIEIEGGSWFSESDGDTKITILTKEKDLIPIPREELTDKEREDSDLWYSRVSTNPIEGDYSFFRMLDWSGDGRLGGNRLIGILDMPLSVFMNGKWKPIYKFPTY